LNDAFYFNYRLYIGAAHSRADLQKMAEAVELWVKLTSATHCTVYSIKAYTITLVLMHTLREAHQCPAKPWTLSQHTAHRKWGSSQSATPHSRQ